MRITFYGEIVAIQYGQYNVYVVRNLDEPNNSLFKYITITKLPNWNCKNLEINDIGYFECEYVNAGETYFKTSTGTKECYNYTVCYLINFIENKKQIELKDFNF